MEFTQRNFSAGINQLDDDTEIADNEYRLLINGRQRFGEVVPIKQSVEVTLPRDGNVQGGICTGNTTIIFIDGRAYYRIGLTGGWIRIADFQMDETARRLWAIAVPKSSKDYVRKLNGSANNPIIINANVTISGNPAGIVVQDGINQPWLIQFNAVAQAFVARELHTYSEWSNTSLTADDREYVPIGKQMMFLNEKLYIVAPDGLSIYQSVTGRPLDFMVNVDSNGNKLSDASLGGAASVSFAFDSDEITCIQTTNITDTFLYATRFNVRLISLDYSNTIFGEPRYSQAQQITAGILNDVSVVDVLGDTTFIDGDGIKSFNGVMNYRVEGRNSIFSLGAAKLLNGLVQTAIQAATASFDNYAIYYCKTMYGKAMLIYDMLRQKWVSLDISNVVDVKQFLVFDNGTETQLLAVTSNGLFELYNSDSYEMAQLHLKVLSPENVKKEHKGYTVQPVFRGATDAGILQVQEYADGQFSARLTNTIEDSTQAMIWPLIFPIGFSSRPNARNNVLVFDKGKAGKKLAYVILWNTDAGLMSVKITTSEVEPQSALRQGASS